MSDKIIKTKMEELPTDLKKEVLDYIEFLQGCKLHELLHRFSKKQ